MLTRLKVSGFKNLVDVDVSFGPFTCIAGANGVGKSNLFDAIRFLSALADNTFVDAALSVRDEGGRATDLRTIFHRVNNQYASQISFEVEMIIPPEGVDDLKQQAKASITFVRYKLILAYRQDEMQPALGSLELIDERLEQINLRDAAKHLSFDHSAKHWRKSVIQGKRSQPFISTVSRKDGDTLIQLHQDGGSGGRPKSFLADSLPRTVLSTTTAIESPTALLARHEMRSWRLLQLEPSALRKPDEFTAIPGLQADGAHLPATLDYLRRISQNGSQSHELSSPVYNQVAMRLSELIDDVYGVDVDRDERRELLTLQLTSIDGTIYPARALSDGTLRFLALAVLEIDLEATGVICMEEPENGIHPGRIEAMLRLLQDIAVDVTEPIGLDNPLRQVIINTHSPSVVTQIPGDALILGELHEKIQDGQRFKSVRFRWLPDTWRAKAAPDQYPISLGRLLRYLNPTPFDHSTDHPSPRANRVIDMPSIQPYLTGWGDGAE